jgi:acyl-CoA synthetase (NDP forming)
MPRDRLADRLREAGVPIVEGVGNALCAVGHLMQHAASGRAVEPPPPSPASPVAVARWRKFASTIAPDAFDEATGYDMLMDWGVETPRYRRVGGAEDLSAALAGLTLPVVLKTAAPGIAHKSEVGGVAVGLADPAEVESAYASMSERLGAKALVVEMAPMGVELVVGGLVDPQFGPFVMIGSGGILVELVKDVAFVMAPASEADVDRALEGLKAAALLEGLRGAAPVNRRALIETIVRISHVVADLSDRIAGIEINPLLATPNGCLPLDVLVTPRAR